MSGTPGNHPELLDAIADNWGGKGTPRWVGPDGHFRFSSNPEDGFVYRAEIIGDRVFVQCVNDTPDSWFWVELDGWHRPQYGADRLAYNVFCTCRDRDPRGHGPNSDCPIDGELREEPA